MKINIFYHYFCRLEITHNNNRKDNSNDDMNDDYDYTCHWDGIMIIVMIMIAMTIAKQRTREARITSLLRKNDVKTSSGITMTLLLRHVSIENNYNCH